MTCTSDIEGVVVAAKASHFGSNTVPSGLSMLVDDDSVVADVSDVAAYAAS